jgi:hypothetical protein
MVERGKLDDHLLGHHGDGRGHAEACAEDHFAVGAHFGGFDHGHVKVAVESVAEVLAHMAQVRVEIVHAALVAELAGVGLRLVGRADGYGVGAGQLSVHVVVG